MHVWICQCGAGVYACGGSPDPPACGAGWQRARASRSAADGRRRYFASAAAIVVCFAYPEDRFKDKPTFMGTAFFVGVVDESEKACLQGSSDGEVESHFQGLSRQRVVGEPRQEPILLPGYLTGRGVMS